MIEIEVLTIAGGDRRGRRSRRRRGRGGRGIPENKYAQPSTGEAAPADAEVLEADSGPEDEPAEPLSDVIILPGESLAKYRGRPEPAPASHPEPRVNDVVPEAAFDEPDEDEEDSADEDSAEEEIAAEAESLELTDKVFGHHDEEPQVLEEESKDC